MIKRDLTYYLLQDAEKIPVIAILGPRQSGKTTLQEIRLISIDIFLLKI